MGIVSALARTQGSANDYQFFIQTDAAINPGNSGGALVTTDGKLAGINTAIYSRSGGNIGIGFAIPANLARRVVEGVEGGGGVRLAWIGATGQPVTSAIADSLGLARPGGVLVKDIYPGGPLANAGVKIRRCGAVGGRRECGRHAVAQLPHRHPQAGRQREGAGRIRQERPRRDRDPGAAAGKSAARSHRHCRAQSADRARKWKIFHPPPRSICRSIFWRRAWPSSPSIRNSYSGNYGFQPGDIVRSVNGASINRVGELSRALNGANHWDLVIERGGRKLTLSVDG